MATSSDDVSMESSVPDAATASSDEEQSQSTAASADAAASSSSSAPPDDDAEVRALALKDEGNARLTSGRPLEAVAFYSDALELAPTNAVILSNRAMAYVKVENYGLAIQDGTRAIRADPNYPKGYYRRGTAHFALNKYKAARKDFRKVCQLRPKDRDARLRLATCEKAIREAAFAAAIESEETAPLSDTYDPSELVVDVGYDGPHPAGGVAPMTDSELEKEEDLFRPGRLPMEFVMAAIQRFKDQKILHKRYVARLLIAAKRHFEVVAGWEVGDGERASPRVLDGTERRSVDAPSHAPERVERLEDAIESRSFEGLDLHARAVRAHDARLQADVAARVPARPRARRHEHGDVP